ncbi:RNA polymerase sigma factor [Sphingobacterium paludis]|uniref:RNA polymerase sigma-70 factor (ECF subfamily) n=1 Tax=Sphingobacterium paludis TaxID=1476465 RepID=A0A4R7D7J8_9SPHI|nr:RNA polymerase sigma-70 factor [Sphingobacterium paludis]TDS14976.1 RNA polymerase sigma-70 factor (ECF subfamily) [Sphingobacterium paludis]
MQNNDYGILSDEVLMDLIRHDDQQAFAMLYQRYSGALYAHAYNFIHDREESKDVLQKVFAKIWDIRNQLPLHINISAYLYQTVKHVLINHIARSKVADRYVESLSSFANSYVADTDHSIREKQLQQIIAQEIAQLPPKMRTIFELSRTAYLTHRQIAEKLGISEKTVKNQISNALKLLRAKLPELLFLLAFFPPKN